MDNITNKFRIWNDRRIIIYYPCGKTSFLVELQARSTVALQNGTCLRYRNAESAWKRICLHCVLLSESRGQSESPPAVPKPDREEPSDEKTDAADAKSVTALYGFVGDTDGDLSFAAGDVIGDVGAVDAEWLRGTLRGRTGIFPTKYVEDFQV